MYGDKNSAKNGDSKNNNNDNSNNRNTNENSNNINNINNINYIQHLEKEFCQYCDKIKKRLKLSNKEQSHNHNHNHNNYNQNSRISRFDRYSNMNNHHHHTGHKMISRQHINGYSNNRNNHNNRNSNYNHGNGFLYGERTPQPRLKYDDSGFAIPNPIRMSSTINILGSHNKNHVRHNLSSKHLRKNARSHIKASTSIVRHNSKVSIHKSNRKLLRSPNPLKTKEKEKPFQNYVNTIKIEENQSFGHNNNNNNNNNNNRKNNNNNNYSNNNNGNQNTQPKHPMKRLLHQIKFSFCLKIS